MEVNIQNNYVCTPCTRSLHLLLAIFVYRKYNNIQDNNVKEQKYLHIKLYTLNSTSSLNSYYLYINTHSRYEIGWLVSVVLLLWYHSITRPFI